MARVNNLTNFLNDVATAIKQKLGDNTPIPASQFDTKIGEIETGGNYQTKSISITTNGNYTQLPDTGYDAMDQVVISVNVPQTGGAVKLFTTEQAMQADPNPQEGDLAVIYRSEIQNWDGESAVSSFYFPDTVTFTTAISEEFWVYGDGSSGDECSINGRVSTSSANFSVENWDTGLRCEITYTSSDGLTYTRTDSEGNPIDLGDAQTFRMHEWDEKAGEFIQTGGMMFDGLFQYSIIAEENGYIKLTGSLNNYVMKTPELTVPVCMPNAGTIDVTLIIKTLELCQEKFYDLNVYIPKDYYILYNDVYQSSGNSAIWASTVLKANDSCTIGGNNYGGTNNRPNEVGVYIEKYVNKVMTDSVQYTNQQLLNMRQDTTTSTSSNWHWYTFNFPIISAGDLDVSNTCSFKKSGTNFTVYANHCVAIYDGNLSDLPVASFSVTTTDEYTKTINYHKYIPAQNQFNLTNPNQLLPRITALGKEEPVTGDGTIYNNLDWSQGILDNCPTDTFGDYFNFGFKSNIVNMTSPIYEETIDKKNAIFGFSEGSKTYTVGSYFDATKLANIIGLPEHSVYILYSSIIYNDKIRFIIRGHSNSGEYAGIGYWYFVTFDNHNWSYFEVFNSTDLSYGVSFAIDKYDNSLCVIKDGILSNYCPSTKELIVAKIDTINNASTVLYRNTYDNINTDFTTDTIYSPGTVVYNNKIYLAYSAHNSSYKYWFKLLCINNNNITILINYNNGNASAVYPRFSSWLVDRNTYVYDNKLYFVNCKVYGTPYLSYINLSNNTIVDVAQLNVTYVLTREYCNQAMYEVDGTLYIGYINNFASTSSSGNQYHMSIYKHVLGTSTVTKLAEFDYLHMRGDEYSRIYITKIGNYLYFRAGEVYKLDLSNDTASVTTDIPKSYLNEFCINQHNDIQCCGGEQLWTTLLNKQLSNNTDSLINVLSINKTDGKFVIYCK